jgi:outer membrane receptor protein involved in Fe transport
LRSALFRHHDRTAQLFNNDGNAFARFLLGDVFSASRAVPTPLRHFADDMYAFYAEDTVKVTSKFTLILGLRYELPIYSQEQDGIISFLNLNQPNLGAGGRPASTSRIDILRHKIRTPSRGEL